MALVRNVSREVLTLAGGAPLIPWDTAVVDTTEPPESNYLADGLILVISAGTGPPVSASVVLGKLELCGTYDSTVRYTPGQVVVLSGASYASLVSQFGVTPVDDGVNWIAMATPGVTQGTTNTGQILQSQGATWDASTVPFITTPAKHSGVASGQVLNDNTSTENFFQVTSYIANTGTAPSIALGGFAVGRQVWSENLLAGAMGLNAAAICEELDVGIYPSHCLADFTNASDTLTNVVTDRPGSRFSVGDTLLCSFGGFPAGATIIAVTGSANAPTSIQMSAPATASGAAQSVSANSTGQTATGSVVVGEGGNIGGVGMATGGVAYQVQGNTASGFGTCFRISSTGIASANGVAFLMSALSSTNGIGLYLNACTLASGISLTNGSYTRGLFFNGITASSAIDFGTSTLTQALKFGPGHNVAFDTTTGTKIGNATNQKLAFWNATPITQPSRVGQLTDSTAGTVSTTLAAGITDSVAKNAIASLAAKVNALELIIHNIGISA